MSTILVKPKVRSAAGDATLAPNQGARLGPGHGLELDIPSKKA